MWLKSNQTAEHSLARKIANLSRYSSIFKLTLMLEAENFNFGKLVSFSLFPSQRAPKLLSLSPSLCYRFGRQWGHLEP